MGQPNIAIDFKNKSDSAVTRSARGVACIFVKDKTVSGLNKYTRKQQIKENYDGITKNLISLGFDRYGTNKVLVYSIKQTVTTPSDPGPEVTTDDETLEEALKKLKNIPINYLACDFELSEDDIKALKDFTIERFKKNRGVLVVTDKEIDSEFFINCKTSNIKDKEYETNSVHFAVETAMRFSALPFNQSMTNKPLPYITAADEFDNEDVEAEKGNFIVRFDGENYKYGRAVTGLQTLSDGKTLDMKNVQVMEGMCLVKGDIASAFENYIGNYNNTDPNRLIFIAEANEYLRQLGNEGVLNPKYNNHVEIDINAMRDYMEYNVDLQGNPKAPHDTSAMSDEEVSIDAEGWTDTIVFLTGSIRFSKAMEDLKLTMYI